MVRAAYVEALGDASAIRYGRLPDPVPGPRQVLVRVEAVAVNTVDTLVRSGRWVTEVEFPLVLGRDLAGTVAAAGAAVTDLPIGARVWTNSAGYGGRPGATAELVAVDRERLYPLPARADPVAFIASVHPGATAYGVLTQRARVREGETVAVIGANGAVGACLVQVAAASGASVVAVVRDDGPAARLRELGARHVVVADAGRAVEQAVRAAPGGVDVLVDTTGAAGLSRAPELLNERGRLVLIAGRTPLHFEAWQFYTRQIEVLGFIMSGMDVTELAAAARWMAGRYPGRPLEVGIGQVLSFADARRAHELLEQGGRSHTADGLAARLVLTP
jgi:NADPH:quinone reductase-like Zn-dependent oxidoreductase